MRTRTACCLVLAPNIELGRDDGGRLGALLLPLLAQARDCAIPVVYALSRVQLGQVHAGAAPVQGAVVQHACWACDGPSVPQAWSKRGC